MKKVIKNAIKNILFKFNQTKMKESNIFNPKSKIIANVDRAIEHIKTGYTTPVLIEVDPSNACNHACSFCLWDKNGNVYQRHSF